jgi:hypothetical protein
MKNFFHGEYLFPKNFKAHFTSKSKKSNNFDTVKDSRKIPKPTYTNRVKESNGDFTSGLTRLIAAEIVFPPFCGNNKSANNVETVQDRR